MITFEDFDKIEFKTAKIIEANRVEGSEKLIVLILDLAGEKRQIVAGIGKTYNPEDLIGKIIIIVANLEPKTLMGIESNGMLLAAHDSEGNPVILIPEKEVESGGRIT
ncbi:MAG: methionine--tRNA ligase subunit beta [Candidatus Paceibacterota bacterium]|jgi:methionyl-tRNA synthetase